jgi:hypothetical protein
VATAGAATAEAPDAGASGIAMAARRWVAGDDSPWAAPREGARRVPLPAYPFERRRHWVEPPRTAPVAATAGAPVHPRPELDTPYAVPAGDLEPLVARVWGEALGIDGIGRDDGFFDLGGNSLIAARVLAGLRATLPVDVDLTDVLGDPPTVAGQAERIAPRLYARLAALTDDEAAALAAELR